MPPESPVDLPHGPEPCPLPAGLEFLAPRTMGPGCNLLLARVAGLAMSPGVDPRLLRLARFVELARCLGCDLGHPTHPHPRLLLAGLAVLAVAAAAFVSNATRKEAGALVPLLADSGGE